MGTGIAWPQIVCIYYCFLYFALSFATEVVAGFGSSADVTIKSLAENCS